KAFRTVGFCFRTLRLGARTPGGALPYGYGSTAGRVRKGRRRVRRHRRTVRKRCRWVRACDVTVSSRRRGGTKGFVSVRGVERGPSSRRRGGRERRPRRGRSRVRAGR